MEIKALATAVSHVTLYPDRARVTLQGDCVVQSGPLRLLVDELPLALEPESLRVTGQGTARVRILGLDVSRQYYVDTPSAKVQALEQQIEQLEEEQRARQDEQAGWQARAKYLDGLRQATAEFAQGLARGRIDMSQQAELLAFLHEEEAGLRTALRALEKQQRTLTRQLDKLRQELKALQAARPRQRFQASIDAEALSAGEFQLSLSYVVQQAGWQPLYDARLQTGGEKPQLTITALAQVSQNTGQDWPGVTLIVSTARPALNQRLPELKPWFVDELKPLPRAPAVKMARAASDMADMQRVSLGDAVAAEPTMATAAEVAVAETAVAEITVGETAVSFNVSGAVDIPGDGSPHKTTLNQYHLIPRLDYLAVPKHTDAVFRRATLTNESLAPLLAGAVSLFVDEAYIGQTRLDYVPTNGEFELLLGVEERITVARELTRREVDKRLLKDNRQLRYGYQLQVKNLLPGLVQVAIHDHIPVSRHEQIKVKLENVQPAPAEKSDLNLLKWRLSLAGGAQQTIVYEYLVEHPRSLQVVGLID